MRLRYILLSILAIVFIVPSHAQDEVGSNIVSRTMLSADGSKAIEQRVYDNGLGDVVQEVQSFSGSTLPSIFIHHEYDEYRRKVKTWLPVTSSGSDFIKGKMINYYAGVQYDEDSAPFTRTEYDNFLPSQPSAQYKAGAQWQDNDKKDSVTYSEVTGVGMYVNDEGELYTRPYVKYLCTRSVDEDGCPSAEYTDLNGKLLISETSQGQTYYVYDVKGDINYVLPPALSKYIVTNYEDDIIDNADDMMQKYAYIYRYDHQRHCIYKKLPGCNPICYIYDKAGNCILSQDGYQRQRGWWAYSIPDKFGRPCINGVCKYTKSSAEPLHSVFVYAEYNGASATMGGYAIRNLSLRNVKLYTAIYYDDYSFIGRHGVPSSLKASDVSGFTIDTSIKHGMQTGSTTAILDGEDVSGYMYSAMYYDSRYNVAQVRSTNHLGGTDITCTSYSYTGKPLEVKVLHTTDNTGTVEVNTTYTYDGADRKDSYTLSVAHGESATSTTLAYEYNALGRLSKVNRQSRVNLDVEYKYDMHGWLKNINTRNFSEELFYADGLGTPCYNGNISSVKWKNGNAVRGYKYVYDDANRLTQGLYGEGESLTSSNKYNESVEYDAAGNIKTILRYGKVSSGSYGPMDRLTLSYNGYQLKEVSEELKDHDFAGSFEYKQAKGSQYKYNKSGSLIADKSRDIAFILHDYNNNPQKIYFMNGNVTKYVYSGSGQKLRVVHYTAKPNITREFDRRPADLTPAQILYADSTDYLLGGNLILKNGKIEKLLFDGGYVLAKAENPTTEKLWVYYYNQDHLGNIRVVEGQKGNVQQLTNYYPFGAPFVESSSYYKPDYQPYKYNGKELDLMHGLNTYDYGARQYDPILLKWDRVDPLAEKNYSSSPYSYCTGDPVNKFDPDGRDGMAAIDFEKKTIAISQTFYYNKNSEGLTQQGIVSNREINNSRIGHIIVPAEISLVNKDGFPSKTWDVNGWSVSFTCDFIGLDSDEAVKEALKANPAANALCYNSKLESNGEWDPSSRTLTLGFNRGGNGLERGSTINHEIGHSWGLPHENLMPNSPIYGKDNEEGIGIMSYGKYRTIQNYEVEYGVEKILKKVPEDHPSSMNLHIK